MKIRCPYFELNDQERAALRDALVAELAPRFPDCAIVVNFDTDYTD